MPRRRKRQGEPLGRRFHRARQDGGLTLQEAAQRTGIAASSLSRFESDLSQPSFDDVCLMAREYGWPLAYFATGRVRTGADSRALAAHLFHWGLRDVTDAERPILGEVRAFEDVVAESARENARALIEAVPALLLRNDYDPDDLLASARRFSTVRRVGWLNEVAEQISRELDLRWLHPDAARNVRATWVAAWAEIASDPTEGEPDVSRAAPPKEEIPPVTQRWGIRSDVSPEAFLKRARVILGALDRVD
ncbi:MAG: helix-turn-helix domain-containing protein [Vicinamibacteria bacterium]